MTGPYRPTDLLRLAEIYAGAKGLRLSRIGRQATGTGTHRLFGRLARGEGCTMATAARVYEFFVQNWPADLYWPPDIPRLGVPPKKTRRAIKTVELRAE
jgi:hypothetical protein